MTFRMKMAVGCGAAVYAYLGIGGTMTTFDVGIRTKKSEPNWFDEHPSWTIAIVFGIAIPMMALVILAFT